MPPSLKTLFLFLPLISLTGGLSNQQSDSSAGAQKLAEEGDAGPNGIQKSSDGLQTRGKRSEGVLCSKYCVVLLLFSYLKSEGGRFISCRQPPIHL